MKFITDSNCLFSLFKLRFFDMGSSGTRYIYEHTQRFEYSGPTHIRSFPIVHTTRDSCQSTFKNIFLWIH